MISELKIGQKIHGALLVRLQKIGTSSNGKEFARGILEDCSGKLGFICFDEEPIKKLKEMEQNKLLVISGVVDTNKFAEEMKLQITVQKVSELLPEDDVSHLLPVGDFDRQIYETQFKRFVNIVKTPFLRMLLENIFQGEFYAKILQNPAGTKLHHAYLGGLFQHSVDVTKLAVAMGEQIDGVNLDLIIAGSLLHDIGKVQEISADFGFPYTTSGRFVGHIALTVLIVQKKAEELKIPANILEPLIHILLSHHGEGEKGSPVACETREAFIVHYADELDSVMNQFNGKIARGWTFNKMLQRYLWKN